MSKPGVASELTGLIYKIKNALSTAESGDALVEVARNAHKAEQELASVKRQLEWANNRLEEYARKHGDIL